MRFETTGRLLFEKRRELTQTVRLLGNSFDETTGTHSHELVSKFRLPTHIMLINFLHVATFSPSVSKSCCLISNNNMFKQQADTTSAAT